MSNPLLLSILLTILPAILGLRIEINNIHYGFKLVLQGKAVPQEDVIVISPVSVLENTLSDENISGFLTLSDDRARIHLGKLSPMMEMDQFFSPLVITSWVEKPKITVGFVFNEENPHSEDQEALYQQLRTKTLPPQEEF